MSVRRMKLSEFREVVRAVLREFVSKDETSSEPNFNKDVNADPSKAHMDVGLDESRRQEDSGPSLGRACRSHRDGVVQRSGLINWALGRPSRRAQPCASPAAASQRGLPC